MAENNGAWTVRQLYEQQYLPKNRGRRITSERTVDDQRSVLDVLDRWNGSPFLVRDFNDTRLEAYLAWLYLEAPRWGRRGAVKDRKAGRAGKTVNKHRSYLLAIWRFARRKQFRELLGDSRPEDLPEVERYAESEPEPEGWTLDEVNSALAIADGLEGEVCGVPASLWWTSLILVLYYTGWRISSVMALRRGDFDESTGWICSQALTQKHRKNEEKHLPELPRGVLAKLVGHLRDKSPEAALLPWRWDRSKNWITLRRRFRRMIMVPAGLRSKRVVLHKWRATHATHLENAGGNPTESLGHSDPKLYQRHYRVTQLLNRPSPAELMPEPTIPPRFRVVG